jgi:NDP-sugar pyrophosphorylase family protein
VIEQIRDAGIHDIIITTGHLEDLIRVFFQDGSKFGVSITYSREDAPLGTAGPFNLIRDQLQDTFLVMNGDILSDIDLPAMLLQHREEGNIATVGLTNRRAHIDFGVVEVDQNHRFMKWIEKPDIDYLVSTGIYFFQPEALNAMPREGFFNLPDLILSLHEKGYPVGGYIHDGYWLDIGRPDDYEQACADIERIEGK